MQMRAQCIHCLLKRIQFETELVNPDMETEVMEKCLKDVASRFRKGVNSAETATHTHKLAYDLLGVDPYASLKKHSNEVAMKFMPLARDHVERSDDKFKAAVLCSIIGNVLDFGINEALDEPDYFEREFGNLLNEGLSIDDTEKMKKLLATAKRVAYLPDNCGEIVLDRLLIEELRTFEVKITLVVKGEAILTDAMVEDAEYAGLAPLVDEIITTERFAVGLPISDMPARLTEVLADSDLIISKGMGNYESLSDMNYKPVAYLMRIKCLPVAESIGAPLNTNIAKLEL